MLGIVVAPFVLTGLLATIGVVIGTVVVVIFFMWADPAFAKFFRSPSGLACSSSGG